jgi:hypothetical protein
MRYSYSFLRIALNYASTSDINSDFLVSHLCLAAAFSLGTIFLA